MPGMTPVSTDSPLYEAWTAYKASEDYANTRRWARHDQHVDGSLWAAFERGFEAAARLRERIEPQKEEDDQARVVMKC